MKRAYSVLGCTMVLAACGSAPAPAPAPTPPPPAIAAVPARPDSAVFWLDQLEVANVEQGWGTAKANKSVDGNPLKLAGQVYEHGIGSHADALARIRLSHAREFIADVALDDETISKAGVKRGSVRFSFVVDRKNVLTTPILRNGEQQHVDINLSGAHELWLVVDGGDDGIDYDHSDWLNARIIQDPGSPAPVLYKPEPKPGVVLTPEPPATPRINGPAIVGAGVGHPFLFRIPATGQAPLRFSARGLPKGLVLDRSTGIISGLAVRAGESHVYISAGNALGRDGRMITIAVGKGLALTPPMGWNSWNVWGCDVDAQKIRDAADEMVNTGLVQHGWSYINIDDCWMRKEGPDARDPKTHAILTNDKFPDMKGLADYVHAKGLHLGIYIGPNEHTCQGYEASIGHEKEDLAQFVKWGIDYVKYDWCAERRDSVEIKYAKYGAIIRSLPRDIVYSLCEYGMDSVWTWGAKVGGNLWRTTGDITDTWASLSGIGFNQGRMAPYAGPGHWNDPDMLVVGQLGWGPNPRPTRLTPDEQYTHITLWSMLAAPLLIGADMTKLDAFTRNLLTNDEVLAVDQDPLGQEAVRVMTQNGVDVYARPLADGSYAVALFNRDWDDQTMAVNWQQIIHHTPARVRDLWRQSDVSTTGTFGVPTHGAVMLRVWPTP